MHAIMFPNTEFSMMVFIKIFDISYWPVYGQIDIIQKLNECFDNNECENIGSMVVAYFILMVYMIISSILLVNLLIATFR